MQDDLFASDEPEVLIDEDGLAVLYRRWLSEEQSRGAFQTLAQELRWEQTPITLYGRTLLIPRLNAWYGDAGSGYAYSGASFAPRPWTETLAALRGRLERDTGARFNSVLANLYRDGADSVAWHSDDEPELGPEPTIASVSLGASRRFSLRHKTSRRTLAVELADGDLLLMSGTLQRHWEHQLAKTRRDLGPRINLTYRQVIQGST